MIKKINLNIPEKTLTYLIICGGMVVLIALLGIFPLYQYNSNRAGEIKKIKYEIEEQKRLGPVYLNLQKIMENKDLLVLPNPKKTTISREEAAKFQNVFRAIARQTSLMTISLTPDMSAISGSSKLLLHNAVVKGEFANFRKMLIALAEIPYLDRVDEIYIQQNSDSMEFRIKIWLALGS
jgi:hypothetical protein